MRKSSQDQINAAHTQLNSALATYKSVQKNGKKHVTGDKSTITALINSVQYVTVSQRNGSDVSTNTAWTTQAEKNALTSAVSSAQAVVNSYSPSQDQIVNALNQLESAITTYKSAQKYGVSGYAGDKSTLQSLINNGNDLYNNNYNNWGSSVDRNALSSAISYAQRVMNDYYASQSEITNAINDLDYAIRIYNNGYDYGNGWYGDTSWLSSLIRNINIVEISYSGDGRDVYNNAEWTTQYAHSNIQTAIRLAENVLYSSYPTQEQINRAISDLQYATDEYNRSKSINYW